MELVGKGRRCAHNKDCDAESVDERGRHRPWGTASFLRKSDKDLAEENDVWVAVPRKPVASAWGPMLDLL